MTKRELIEHRLRIINKGRNGSEEKIMSLTQEECENLPKKLEQLSKQALDCQLVKDYLNQDELYFLAKLAYQCREESPKLNKTKVMFCPVCESYFAYKYKYCPQCGKHIK